jgi:small subunit ribosomal protein S16
MQRFGRRHRPFYRINAVDKRAKRDGRVIENLGWYDPLETDESKQVLLKEERIKHWLEHGAQPSETVATFLAKANLIDVEAWEAGRKVARDRLQAKKAAEAAATEAAPSE